MAWRCCSKVFSPTRSLMIAIRSRMVLKARFRSVPVCSAVEAENTCEHSAVVNLFVSVRLWYAQPTVHCEPVQLSLEIDRLAVEKVQNVDHFIKLGREEEDLVVWTHAEGWNLCRCQADWTQVIFDASTCPPVQLLGRVLLMQHHSSSPCFKLHVNALLLSNQFCDQ